MKLRTRVSRKRVVIRQLLYGVLLASMLILGTSQSGVAQDPFADDNDVYVDDPGAFNPGAPNALQQVPQKGYTDQFHTGFLNLEFDSPLYYQFSGNSIFAGGSLPNSFVFTSGGNIAWNRVMPLDFEYFPGYAFGADFMYYTSTSGEAYNGAEDVDGPSINTNLFLAGVNAKAYFMDPFAPMIHPYVGLGWGFVYGQMSTQKESGARFNTTLSGLQTYRSLGMEILLNQSSGLFIEFRIQTSYVTASNDPFDQASNSSLRMDLNGVMIGLSGFYRF